eukprot:1160244-Pelagomonas_calceolata.AAC.8
MQAWPTGNASHATEKHENTHQELLFSTQPKQYKGSLQRPANLVLGALPNFEKVPCKPASPLQKPSCKELQS